MIFSTPSKPLSFSNFEEISKSQNIKEEAIIGKKKIGSGLKESSSGGTSTIVADFKRALSTKYGQKIADLVFPSERELAASSQGLTKKTIATVLKQASILEAAHFLEYGEVLESKKQAASKIVQKLDGTPYYAAVKKKYDELKGHIEAFNDAHNYFQSDLKLSTENLEMLQRSFKEKVSCVEKLTNEVVDLVDLSETIEQSLERSHSEFTPELRANMLQVFNKFSPELRDDLLQVFPQHNQVMEELRKISLPTLNSTPTPLIETNIDPLIRTIKKATTLLSSFSAYFNEENSPNDFSLNKKGEVIVQDSTDNNILAQRSQILAANAFFDALKQLHGETFVNQLQPEQEQHQSLTVEKAQEIFKKIQTSFEKLNSLLAKQPVLITKEYLERLASNEQLAEEAQSDHAALGPDGNLLLRLNREAIDTPILVVLSHFGILTYYVASFTTTLHRPPLLLAMTMSTVAGALGGRIVTRQQNEQVQTEAMGIATASNVGGTLGQIGGAILENSGGFITSFLEAHIPLSGLLTELALGEAGSYAAITIRNAFAGGSVSGALDAEANPEHVPSSVNTNTSSTIGEHHEPMNLEEEVSVIRRLIRSLKLIREAMNQIPIHAESNNTHVSNLED